MHSLRIADDSEVPPRKKCHKGIVVIAIFTSFVTLKAASKRWHQKNYATNRLAGQWLCYFCHEKTIERVVAFLNGCHCLIQIASDNGVLSVDDLVRLSLSGYVDK